MAILDDVIGVFHQMESSKAAFPCGDPAYEAVKRRGHTKPDGRTELPTS